MRTEKEGKLSGSRYLLHFVAPYRICMLAAILTGLMKQVCQIAAIGIGAYMAASVAAGKGLSGSGLAGWMAGAVAGRVIFAYLESYLNHLVAYHILVDFRVRLYRAFEKICPDILLSRRSGQISTTLMNDVELLEWFYAHTVGIFLVNLLITAGLTGFMFWLHPILPVILLAGLAVLVYIPFILRKLADEQGARSRFLLGEANSVTLEGLNGMNEILTLNYRQAYLDKNRRFMDRLIGVQVDYARRMGTEGGLLQAAAGFAAVAMNLCGVWLVLHNQLSISWFAVVGTIVWLVYGPAIELCGMARNFGLIFAAANRIGAILESEPLVKDDGSEVDVKKLEPTVVFDKVTYRYANTSEDVLHEVSFQLRSGQVTALVGESGAGKTTCASLLCRLWDVSGGAIRIGGRDIREMTLENLHDLVTVVPQDVYLFNISMRENIRLGRPSASDEEVEEAARMARVDEFIRSLPDGYDTPAGERGLQMSGGQRQRVAIARALLMDAPILVLDEAVSNLDTRTDLDIQRTIRRLASRKTILLVAHRLSTIVDADHLVVMKGGRVCQEGTHQVLVREKGYYRELVEAQLTGEE